MATRMNSGRRKGAPSLKAKTDASSKARKKPNSRTLRKRVDVRQSHAAKSAANIPAAVTEIKNTVLVIGSMYSASVALRLALVGQGADQDGDLAICVRLQITNVLENVVDRLIGVGRHLGSELENPLET